MSDRTSGGARAPRAIVAGHGDFAAGLVSAVQQITGRGELFRAISARDLSGTALDELLRSTLDETHVDVVFTDLQAGSCSMATRRVLKDRPDVLLVAGANLPMLLDFVMADNLPAIEAARHALERGRAAITSAGGGAGPGGGGKKT
jgi:mannose/fructose-specific phosphotransferase system component IIA